MRKSNLTVEEFKRILNETKSEWEGDNCYQGALILGKYIDYIFIGARHDKVYGPEIEKLIENGITREDVVQLGKLNWGSDYENLYCFV